MINKALSVFSPRQASGAIIVTALSAGFGVTLMNASTALSIDMGGIDFEGVRLALVIVSWIF